MVAQKTNGKESDGPLESLRRIKIFLGQASQSRDVLLRYEGRVLLESVDWALVERLLSMAGSQSSDPMNLVFLVSTCSGVSTSDIFSRSQQQKVAVARNVVFYFLREYAQMSFPEIGRRMSRDHSTVQSGIRRVQSLLDTPDSTVTDLVERVRAVLEST